MGYRTVALQETSHTAKELGVLNSNVRYRTWAPSQWRKGHWDGAHELVAWETFWKASWCTISCWETADVPAAEASSVPSRH